MKAPPACYREAAGTKREQTHIRFSFCGSTDEPHGERKMSETADILPEGLVMEILSWLPVKSLLRFKCVSKTWYQLFSADSGFINLHLDRSKNRNMSPGIIVSHVHREGKHRIYIAEDPTTETRDALCFEIPFVVHRFCRLVNVCNGLVCLTDGPYSDHKNVIVWNPLTGDHIIIPVSPTWHLYSFGFHQGSNEYKILQLVARDFDFSEFDSDVWVYTLGTHSWRNLGDTMDYGVPRVLVSSNTIVNGAFHWIGSKRRPVHIPLVLVSFDLGNEIFQEIPQPNYGKFDGAKEDDEIMYSVGELSGLLCIFRNIRQHVSKMEIWMMKEYGVVDSWSKQFNVFDIRDCNLPVCVAYNEEIIMREYKDDCQLILYNPKTNSIRCIDKFGCTVYDMSSYTGSLLSPTMINGSRHSST